MPAAAPYPFERWPRMTRAQVVQLRTLARALPVAADARVGRETQKLFGEALELRPHVPELLRSDALGAVLPEPLCALRLELEGEARGQPIVIEVAPGAAAALVDRVLGGEGDPAAPVGRTLDELSAGVLAYATARLCGAAGAVLRVREPLASRDAVLGVLGPGPVLVWPLALSLGGRALGSARALIPEASFAALRRRSSAPGTDRLQVIAGIPLALCAHAGRVTLRRAELAALAAGDVVIPDRCRLARDPNGRYGGELELHVIGARRGLSCRLEGHRLTIERDANPGESAMTDTKRIDVTALGASDDLAADAPIELCLEVARFTLPLRELSALRPGEVLNTGSAIGASVTLTAAGRPIARGELVDVDGEVGMRVLELLR